MFQGCLMKVSWEGSFIYVSRVFQEFFKEVSRKRSRCFKKSFMLHGTHRSFPSRRRACLVFVQDSAEVLVSSLCLRTFHFVPFHSIDQVR